MAKIGAMARLRKRRAARLAEKRRAAIAAAPPVPAPKPQVSPAELENVRTQLAAAKEMAAGAKKAPKLVRSGRAAELTANAEKVEEVLVKMERAAAAPVVPVSDVKVALNVFDQAVVVLTVGAEILKISKWYAVGGAAVVAGLFFLAEKQGWLDFLN